MKSMKLDEKLFFGFQKFVLRYFVEKRRNFVEKKGFSMNPARNPHTVA